MVVSRVGQPLGAGGSRECPLSHGQSEKADTPTYGPRGAANKSNPQVTALQPFCLGDGPQGGGGGGGTCWGGWVGLGQGLTQEQALGPGRPSLPNHQRLDRPTARFQGRADYRRPPDLTAALVSGRHRRLVCMRACGGRGGTLGMLPARRRRRRGRVISCGVIGTALIFLHFG